MSARRNTFRRTTLAATVSLALGMTLLTACGQSGSTPAATTPAAETTAETTAEAPAAAATPTVADAWVKAIPDVSNAKMTGIFGNITNPGTEPVNIVDAKTSASDMTEIHETVMKDGEPMMQKIEGAMEIAPGATRELKPGGDHVMAMMLTEPIAVGDTVKVTLITDTGQNIEFDAVAKEFTGADERYADDSDHGGTMNETMTHSPTASGTAS